MAKRKSYSLPAVICGGTRFTATLCGNCHRQQPARTKTWAALDATGFVIVDSPKDICDDCAPVVAARLRIDLERFT